MQPTKIELAAEEARRMATANNQFDKGSWPHYVTATVWKGHDGKFVFRDRRYKREGQAVKAAWKRWCDISKGKV